MRPEALKLPEGKHWKTQAQATVFEEDFSSSEIIARTTHGIALN
jgi:hypothetical protein